MSNRNRSENPYMAIAVGFYLLALPLLISIFLADSVPGMVTNGFAAAIMISLGFALQTRKQ